VSQIHEHNFAQVPQNVEDEKSEDEIEED